MKEYPYVLHKSVLLIDGKIANWKTGKKVWDTLSAAWSSRQPLWSVKEEHDSIEVHHTSKEVHSTEENNAFFNDHEWFKQWPIHERFKGFKPY